jgi:uncharacterized protein (TIGR02646 family)
MVKIDRKPYLTNPEVQKLINANIVWDKSTGKNFSWNIVIDGEGFNLKKKIQPLLLKMTTDHCAFCDIFMHKDNFHPSLEHFKPKDKYPDLAYDWYNLFPSCEGCTEKKGNKFPEDGLIPLKPDEENYTFSAYFKMRGDGKLQPSDTADRHSRERAKMTIEYYGLNSRGMLLSLRKDCLEDYPKLGKILDDSRKSFRFLFSILAMVADVDATINKYIHD